MCHLWRKTVVIVKRPCILKRVIWILIPDVDVQKSISWLRKAKWLTHCTYLFKLRYLGVACKPRSSYITWWQLIPEFEMTGITWYQLDNSSSFLLTELATNYCTVEVRTMYTIIIKLTLNVIYGALWFTVDNHVCSLLH